MAQAMPRPQVDFYELVNETADAFESQYTVTVTPGARKALIDPALPHQQDVERQIATGKMNIPDMQRELFTVLGNANDFARSWDQGFISEQAIEESKKRYCPYVFWC